MTVVAIYIRLKTPKALDKADARLWFKTVKMYLPDGILGSIQTTTPHGDPDNIFMIHKETNSGQHYYEIPLTRDLTEKEASIIETAYAEINPEGDYTIETSSEKVKAMRQGPADAIVIKEEDYNQFCETLAKHRHQRWYDDRTTNGWSFGLKINSKDKTHPMVRPWEQLPDQYKNIDYELPHLLMDMLVNSGYVVVRRDELNKWHRK